MDEVRSTGTSGRVIACRERGAAITAANTSNNRYE